MLVVAEVSVEVLSKVENIYKGRTESGPSKVDQKTRQQEGNWEKGS